MKICPFMSWQYQPAGTEDRFVECQEKNCALWTGLDCAIKQMWLELSKRGI